VFPNRFQTMSARTHVSEEFFANSACILTAFLMTAVGFISLFT